MPIDDGFPPFPQTVLSWIVQNIPDFAKAIKNGSSTSQCKLFKQTSTQLFCIPCTPKKWCE